ncbi:MAG: methylated-DNA--[protein]-cysteine S-methyltransferase [Bacteriovoracaceae bacterium]|nr:methylated-DNA--[protein]-cysteine S-methyltransferase [Bacteriovoracaceae bacterium]
MESFFDYIDTPIGVITYFWAEYGVSSLKVSEKAPTTVKGRAPFFDLTNRLAQYFAGAEVDFSDIELNIGSLSSFQKSVLNSCRDVNYGKTLTYTELAGVIGDTKTKRAVGTALSKNPVPILIPCHRVKGKNDIGGFSAGDGVGSKMFLLELESGQNYLF